MPVTTPKQLFVALLSNLKQSNEKAASIYTEIGQAVQDPGNQRGLEARAFLSEKTVATINQCFKVIGEQPVKFTGRMQEMFIEDFRKELAEIQSPVAKKFFVLAKLTHLTHLRIGEYKALIGMADVSGHHGVALMLESCLADKVAFAERTRCLVRHMVEQKVAARAA